MNNANGYTIFSLFVSLLLTIPLTLVLTKLFKRRVEKMINAENDFSQIAPEPVLCKNPAPFPGVHRGNKNTQSLVSSKNIRPAFRGYFIPGLIVCLLLLYLVYLNGEKIKPVMALYLLLTVLFPFLFIVYILAIPGKNIFRKALLVYLATLLLMLLYFSFRNDLQQVISLFFYTFILQVWPVLIFFFLRSTPAIKTIGPFVFPVVFAGMLLILMGYNLLGTHEKILQPIFFSMYRLFAFFHIADWTITGFNFFMLLIFFLIIAAGLLFIRLAYLSKIVNGEILLIDCLWATQVIYMLSGPYKDTRAIIYPVGVLAVYKILQWAIMKFVMAKPGEPASLQLLVLRVFSLGRESEKLFSQVSPAWLSKGSLKLIAGFDLTNTVVDIDDLLIYLSGRIRKKFCLNEALIRTNIGKIDKRPDIDGRYRVNELYCNNSTWKEVLNCLLPETDRILMDLRGFSTQHKGCAHEIRQIIYTTPLDKVLFVCDSSATSESSEMCKLMKAAWDELPAASPNYSNTHAKFFVYPYSNKNDLKGLLDCLS